MIDWRKKHKFVFSDTTESANYCICGLPEDNPLHTDYKEREAMNDILKLRCEDCGVYPGQRHLSGCTVMKDNQFDLEWQKEREKADIEWLEKAEKVMPEVVRKIVNEMKAKEIIEALRPEWEEWHKYCYQDKPLPFDGHPDFWEWLMERKV